ncbi:membrane-bound lytic murein transglycosylase D [Paenacidovorax caeni]|uniref:Membrane-bound lytic murein transglycosylase D n=1 Tax=Paenacidovorax caeni TaxID=343013 RepID=A0A1I7JEF0_9BURK|nr:transglycosylase SLT domain-containing protein [Paenacidovorax caeni]SFU83533.1 membrane-bound lytic murein transglycosylase D [Paenacidovorax caeni]
MPANTLPPLPVTGWAIARTPFCLPPWQRLPMLPAWRWLRRAAWWAWALLLSACQSLPGGMAPGMVHAPALQASTPAPGMVQAGEPVRDDAPPSPLGTDVRDGSPRWEGGLWLRLRQGMAVEPLRGDALLRMRQMEQWYQERPAYLQRVFERARPYLFDIVSEAEAAGLPLEVALLPAVESAFLPQAVSTARADGLWQFMAHTAQRFQLRQNMFLDERRSPRAAAQAAMRYLALLRERYGGDMQLALAAYNCGEGCIDAHRRKAQAQGLAGRLEDLRLNPETAYYVPRLMALGALVARAVDGQNLALASLPVLPDAPAVHTLVLHRDIDKALAARMAGLSEAELEALNPQHKKPLLIAAAGQGLVLPLDRVGRFEQALAAHRAPLASWSAARVGKHASVEHLARVHGSDAASIRAVNAIAPGHVVMAGSTVLVPRPPSGGDVARHLVEQATIRTSPPFRQQRVQVKKGWGWAEVARVLSRNGGAMAPHALHAANPGVRLRAGWVRLQVPVLGEQK